MPKAKPGTSNSKKRTPYQRKKKDQNADAARQPGFQGLLQIKATNEKEYGQPKRTRKAYEGYIKSGKAFLNELVMNRRQDDKTMEDRQETDGLEQAFSLDRPNRYSAMALELFLTQKCLHKGLGASTAVGIHAAWTAYWDNM
jgi:hypothetical protein